MSTDRIRIELTKNQQEQIKQESGHDVPSIEPGVQQLEERVAPVSFSFGEIKITYTPQQA